MAIKLREDCEFVFRAPFAKTAITPSSGKRFTRFSRVRKLETKLYMFYPAPVPKTRILTLGNFCSFRFKENRALRRLVKWTFQDFNNLISPIQAIIAFN